MVKKDFPIFDNNKWLVYLDNTASTQKPQYVIDWVSEFVANDYANIHRWLYSVSERSEEIYHKSKEAVAELIWCKVSEVIYTYNSTYWINLIAQSLCKSKKLWKWDTVLIGMREHHSNVLPWQILAEEYWFVVKFIAMDQNYGVDWKDFDEKYDDSVRVVSVSHVSNVTGKIYDVKKIGNKLRDDTFFIIDWSQSVPNFKVSVVDIDCDAYVFTGHKLMAYTGIWVVYLKKEHIKSLTPMIAWGGTVEDVSESSFKLQTSVDKFESGTPNIIWAVSLLKAIEYVKSIWWIEKIREHEQKLVKYTLSKFTELKWIVELVWPNEIDGRVGVFSFVIPSLGNFNKIGEVMAENNVCIRCGGHCAYPLHKWLNKQGTCRMSLYIYNDEHDIDRFFEVLKSIIS